MAVSPQPVPRADVDPDDPRWTRPEATPDEMRNDALAAVCLFVGAVLSMVLWRTTGLYEEPASGTVSVICLAAVTLPLAARRRWPSAVLVVVSAAFVGVGELAVPETLFANIALFTALYTVGAWEPVRARANWLRAVVVSGMFCWLLLSLFRSSTDPEGLGELDNAGMLSPLVAYSLIQILINLLYFAGAYWFGNHSWSSARERARTAWRSRQLQAERVRSDAQAVTIERLRLARELHDAVAHHVSVMGVQAAAARTILDTDPAGAATALERIEDSARDAVEELHGLIGTLREQERPGNDAPDEPVGSLGVDRLERLVHEAEVAGVPTTFRVIGEPTPLPPVLSLNLYRIAQEALTNVRKHAGGGASADVRLRYLDGAVELEVSDDGVGPRRSAGRRRGAGGLGLLGMRERVAADAGTLETVERRDGGFVVRAQVPLQRADAVAAVGSRTGGEREA